ncbi:MAG: helix-turn-helix domain-containing protein [Archaeoglobaceae archaeon]
MLKIEIETPTMENCLLAGISKISKLVEINVEGFLSIEDRIKALLKLKTENLENVVENMPEFCQSIRLSKNSARVLLKEHPCLIAPLLLKAGGIIRKMKVEGKKLIWDVVCDDEGFLKLMEALESAEIEYEIIYKGRLESEDTITLREEEILKIALQKGFFDYPRKIRLEELAKQLGMAPSTLSEIMRRGQKKILQKFFE